MRLSVRVTPRAKQNSITYNGTVVRVRLTAPPVDGEANEALRTFLAREFSLRKPEIKIISGFTARDKIVEILEPTEKLKKFLGQQSWL